jgi:hypothetical protein
VVSLNFMAVNFLCFASMLSDQIFQTFQLEVGCVLDFIACFNRDRQTECE